MSHAFIDSHCHFDFPPFINDAISTLERSSKAGIKHIIVPAVTADHFDTILNLSLEYPMLHSALGLHPLYIEQHNADSLSYLEQLISQTNNHIVALGEIGLDLYMDNPLFEKQLVLLQKQLQLAKQHNLPVILHSRKSHDQLVKALRYAALSRCGVVHGFSGSLSQAQAFIHEGYYIGVGGTITYQRAKKTRAVIASLPLESLLLETDAPDMPLTGFQGQPNHPERVVDVFHTLCQLRRESPNVIAETIYQNTITLFQLA